MFRKLSVSNWRQFAQVDMEFHERLTVIAGANGAGKSTLVRILAQFFGINHTLVGVPLEGDKRVYSHAKSSDEDQDVSVGTAAKFGSVVLTNGDIISLAMPSKTPDVITGVILTHFQNVPGMFFHPHMGANRYVGVGHLPISGKGLNEIFNEVIGNHGVISHHDQPHGIPAPLNSVKTSMITMAAFGPGGKYITPNSQMEAMFEGFRDLLREFLPESLGFKDFSVRLPELVLITKTGEFALDAASGGITTLINLAWALFILSKIYTDGFSVVIDEPENHLHPAMQRELMVSLLQAFPKTQFIVATHSPFIVSSIRDSRVYALRYDEAAEGGRRVYSEQLDGFNKAGTAGDILRSVLGVPVTMPSWAEDEIEAIARDFNIQNLTEASVHALRGRLEAAGLGSYYAQTLSKMAERL